MMWYYIIVLHVLSTPRYDTDRLEWSEDIMRFDTVVYCCDLAMIVLTYGPDLVLPRVGRINQGTVDLEDKTQKQTNKIALQFG